jgi:hypothetical protein
MQTGMRLFNRMVHRGQVDPVSQMNAYIDAMQQNAPQTWAAMNAARSIQDVFAAQHANPNWRMGGETGRMAPIWARQFNPAVPSSIPQLHPFSPPSPSPIPQPHGFGTFTPPPTLPDVPQPDIGYRMEISTPGQVSDPSALHLSPDIYGATPGSITPSAISYGDFAQPPSYADWITGAVPDWSAPPGAFIGAGASGQAFYNPPPSADHLAPYDIYGSSAPEGYGQLVTPPDYGAMPPEGFGELVHAPDLVASPEGFGDLVTPPDLPLTPPEGFGDLVPPDAMPAVPPEGFGDLVSPPSFAESGSQFVTSPQSEVDPMLESLAQGPYAQLQSTIVDSTGHISQFDPTTGGYTPVSGPAGWTNRGYGAGSPYGAGSAGFAGGGFGGYGGLGGSGAPVTGHINTGINDSSVYQTGGVDPSSDSSPGPMDALMAGHISPEAQRQPGDIMRHGVLSGDQLDSLIPPQVDWAQLSPYYLALQNAPIGNQGLTQPWQLAAAH